MDKDLVIVVLSIALFVMTAFIFYEGDGRSITGKVINNGINSTRLPITYVIDKENCGERETNRINQAFDIIQNSTNDTVRFRERNSVGDIILNCTKTPKYSNPDSEIIEDIFYIYFFEVDVDKDTKFSQGCLIYPNTEIRKILHFFGFRDSQNRYSIMNVVYPGCLIRTIDQDIIDELVTRYTK